LDGFVTLNYHKMRYKYHKVRLFYNIVADWEAFLSIGGNCVALKEFLLKVGWH